MSSTGYFNEVAGKWDEMRQGFFSDELREKAYQLAGVQVGSLAADVGAGTGFLTEGLLKKGLRVIAVDQSEEMLERMKEKFKDFEGMDCRRGDAGALPVDTASVDYVMANMFLHHVEEPGAAIKEMARILKPGGKFVLTDLDTHTHEFLRTEQHDRWMGFERADIKNWLSDAGLVNVQVDCAGGNCCAESSCGCDSASISIFIAYGEKSNQ